jgi:hypothetical protein
VLLWVDAALDRRYVPGARARVRVLAALARAEAELAADARILAESQEPA